MIEQGGYAILPGAGVPDEAGWSPEPSFLVLGITEETAADVGRLFEQHAIVVGCRGTAARLLWVAAESPVGLVRLPPQEPRLPE